MENANLLYEAILKGNLEQAIRVTQETIDAQIDPQILINEQMVRAMNEIGDRFEKHQAYVPELLLAARAMKGSLELLRPLLVNSSDQRNDIIVIGTVKGDMHDIGKNLVASMLEGCGFETINLGVDVSTDKFVETVKSSGATLVGLSALLTTTMTTMKEVIEGFKECGIRDKVKIMVGGAPVTQQFAFSIGADGYSSNANSAVALARKLVSSMK